MAAIYLIGRANGDYERVKETQIPGGIPACGMEARIPIPDRWERFPWLNGNGYGLRRALESVDVGCLGDERISPRLNIGHIDGEGRTRCSTKADAILEKVHVRNG